MADTEVSCGPKIDRHPSSVALTRRVLAQISLLEHLDTSQLNCLNESPEHTLNGIVASKKRNTGSAYLLSEADEQLLLNIPVRLSRAFIDVLPSPSLPARTFSCMPFSFMTTTICRPCVA